MAAVWLCLLMPCGMRAQQTFEGMSSYYSDRMHGRRMSSGEVYDKNDFVCAHRSLPFGTLLRVTGVANGRSVTVRVTDRGPFGRDRVIDVSRAAARELDMIRAGVMRVRCEVLPSEQSILQERMEQEMARQPDYMKEFALDPPELRMELQWPDQFDWRRPRQENPATAGRRTTEKRAETGRSGRR